MTYAYRTTFSLVVFIFIFFSSTIITAEDITQLEIIEFTFDRIPYRFEEHREFYQEGTLQDREYITVLLFSKAEQGISAMAQTVKLAMQNEEGWRFRTSCHKTFFEKYSDQNSLRIQEKLNLLDESAKGKISHGFSQEIIDRIHKDGYIPINIHGSIFEQKTNERVYSDKTKIETIEVLFEREEHNNKKYTTIIFLIEVKDAIINGEESYAIVIAQAIKTMMKQNSWKIKNFSRKIFLGKYRKENALEIEEKLNNIDQTNNSAVLIIID